MSQNYVCFHANIIVYETKFILSWKDVTSISKHNRDFSSPRLDIAKPARYKMIADILLLHAYFLSLSSVHFIYILYKTLT